MNQLFTAFLVLGMLAVSTNSPAQQSLDLGEYVVHYNALNSNLLPAQMTQAYGIQRSPNRAILIITALKKEENDALGTPVHADVTASAVNLSGQRRDIKMREISDLSGAVYYIGVMTVYNLESFRFTVNLKIEGLEKLAVVQFSQQFFTE
jgi:uridine phosphorylase